MVLLHLNTRSLWNKKDISSHYLNDSNIDVFTISESWLHAYIPNQIIHFPGYTLLRNERDPANFRADHAGGGVAMYISSDLTVDETKMANFNRSSGDLETLWVSLNSKTTRKFLCAPYTDLLGETQSRLQIHYVQILNIFLVIAMRRFS